ncbi:MAG: DUF4388 domain-containing protein [Thermodesulfovibrionales bacterium]
MDPKERRHFKRYSKITDFDLKLNNRYFKARTLDYSLSGISALVEGAFGIRKGDIVELSIKEPDMCVTGEVKWAKSDKSGLRIGIGNIGKLRGRLQDFRLPDTLIGLQRSQKTGILKVENEDIIKKVYIKNGDMIFSSSNQEEDRLGDLLLKEGKITIEQYNHSVSEMKNTKQRQGAVLVRLGYLKPMELVAAVKHQVEEIILGLFALEKGSFEFQEASLPTEEVITLKLSAANIIYYGTKRINNFEFIENELPSIDSIPCFSPDPLDLFQDITLDDSGRKIISCIDGKTSVKEVMSITQLDDFGAFKTIYALLNAKIIEIAEGKPDFDLSNKIANEIFGETKEQNIDQRLRDEIENMYNNYERRGYYCVLGVNKYASIHEIKRAYYKAAKKFHPDMHFRLADDVLKDKLNDIFTYLYEGYETLSNPQKRKEYDKLMTLKPAKLLSNQDKAKELFEEGKTHLKKSNFQDAELLFGQAVYYDSTIAEYQYHYGLTLMKLNKFRYAEKAIKRALKLEPYNADYLAELGFVYLALGYPIKAKAFFEKAIKISPDNVRASEGISKIK